MSARTYIGLHRPETVRPVDPDWTPLRAGVRQHLGPHHYAETALHAPVTEQTAHLDPAAVAELRATTTPPAEPATTEAVLAEMRADLTTGEEPSS